MNSVRPEINTQIFSWALNRMGVILSDAEEKFPKLQDWINGTSLATVNQLISFSKQYNFPFGYFFLKQLPLEEKLPIPFFRSSDEYSAEENENVIDTVKILKERQEWLSDYFKDNGAEKCELVGLLREESNVTSICKSIESYLELPIHWNQQLKSPEIALKFLTNLLDENNIIVTFNSMVKNNPHRKIPVKLCRGFCLVDEYTPFIFVNSDDSKKAQLFTLIHELAHLFISFSAGFGDFGTEFIGDPKEALCDKVAANILVPKNQLIDNYKLYSNEELSDFFKASEIVILRRKLDCGLISKEDFFKAYDNLSPYKKNGIRGGNFYTTAEKRIGPKFIRSLYSAMKSKYITPMDAYYLSGLKGDTFHKLANKEFS